MLPAHSAPNTHSFHNCSPNARFLDKRPLGTPVLDTGFSKLNDALEQGGWPQSGLIELLCAGPCPQSLRLLLPVMAARQDGLTVLANPPTRPRADTLQQAGIASHRLLVMRSQLDNTLLDACHDAARSGSVAVLVIWLPELMDDHHALRRLHLAAREGHCLLVAMRTTSHAQRPSPATLRLRLRTQPPTHLGVEIIKQPGGWGGKQINLALLPERLPMTGNEQPAITINKPRERRLHDVPTDGNRIPHYGGYQDPTSRFSRPKVQPRRSLKNLPF